MTKKKKVKAEVEAATCANWHTVDTLWGVYKTHLWLQYGSDDDSCSVERANILHIIRSITGLWQGEIQYDYDADDVRPSYTNNVGSADADELANLDILATHLEPDDKPLATGTAGVPKAIIHSKGYSITRLFIHTDILDSLGIQHTLNTNPILDNDAFFEVEAIIRDSYWGTDVKPLFEEQLTTLYQTDIDYRSRMVGIVTIVGVGTVYEGPIVTIEDKYLKAAFWEALNQTGIEGTIENTAWVFSDDEISKLAKKAVDILTADPNQKSFLQ